MTLLPCDGSTIHVGEDIDYEGAQRACMPCPRKDRCLALALTLIDRREPIAGVWGGLHPRQITAMAEARQRTRLLARTRRRAKEATAAEFVMPVDDPREWCDVLGCNQRPASNGGALCNHHRKNRRAIREGRA